MEPLTRDIDRVTGEAMTTFMGRPMVVTDSLVAEGDIAFGTLQSGLEALLNARLREKLQAAVDAEAKLEEDLVLNGDPNAPKPQGVFDARAK